MSLQAAKMRNKLEKLQKARERFEEKVKILDEEMVQGRSNMIKIQRGLRNKEIVEGTIEVTISADSPVKKSVKRALRTQAANINSTTEPESTQQQVLVPSGPRVSDWCYLGSYDSNPPVVKSNTVYETIRFLARGAFGDVNLVKCIEDNRLYAIKTIFAERESDMKAMLMEVKFLRLNRHPCIIDVHDGFITAQPRMLYIVMPYCEGGDMDTFIKNTRKNKLTIPEDKIIKWTVQIGLAIHHMHENGMIHRDLKPNNVMLADGGDLVKLVDFGLAMNMLEGHKSGPVEAGTPYYTAPEIIQNVQYTYPIDCWSFGIMLHEMLRLELPFRGSSTADLVKSILEDEPPEVPAHYSFGIKMIASELLRKDPNQRMGMAGMLMHPLLQQKAAAFPLSYRPKAVEERIRRSHVRQLNAQVDSLSRSKHSSLIGSLDIIPLEARSRTRSAAPSAPTTPDADPSAPLEVSKAFDENGQNVDGDMGSGGIDAEANVDSANGDHDNININIESDIESDKAAAGGEGGADTEAEGEAEAEVEAGDEVGEVLSGSRKRQELNAAIETADRLANTLDEQMNFAEGDEEEEDD